MPKMTVLEMTQDILNDMVSDEVNSINDTLESLAIAQVLKTTYFDVIDQRDQWDHLGQLGRLNASGDADLPTHMTLADKVQKIKWIKYNTGDSGEKDVMSEIVYMEPKEFMDWTADRDSTDSTIKKVQDPESSAYILIRNDIWPTRYTTFDDETLIFDAWKLADDSTLTQAKSQWFGYKEPTFSILDDYTPDLPAKLFSYYLAEAKSVCFNSIKQAPNAKEEQRSRRARWQMSREKRRAEGGGIKYPNYGRTSQK